MSKIDQNKIDARYKELYESNLKRGYFLGPEIEFTKDLINGLLINKERYGYESCPCRLATGKRKADLDIICPCDYRDPDVVEHGCCYCGLYVSKKIFDGNGSIKSIPERRPTREERLKMAEEKTNYPVWRCEVCGYVCAREDAPDICPICGASHDRFKITDLKIKA